MKKWICFTSFRLLQLTFPPCLLDMINVCCRDKITQEDSHIVAPVIHFQFYNQVICKTHDVRFRSSSAQLFPAQDGFTNCPPQYGRMTEILLDRGVRHDYWRLGAYVRIYYSERERKREILFIDCYRNHDA